MIIDSAIQYFRGHEGVVSHMYQCVHGHVTIGVGREKRWADAARECNRGGVSPARNAACAALFEPTLRPPEAA